MAAHGSRNPLPPIFSAYLCYNAPMLEYACFVERVIDGDTVVLAVDLGLNVTTRIRLRLEGLDAAPMGEAAGQMAHMWVKRNLESKTCTLRTEGDTDRYGRFLGDLMFTPAQAGALNDYLQAPASSPPVSFVQMAIATPWMRAYSGD